MMQALASPLFGKEVTIHGRTVAELEQAAERLGCVRYVLPVDGGVEVYRKLCGEWIVTARVVC